MASPFRYFRKNQKFFLALAAGIAMFVFVLADPLSQWLQQQAGVGPNKVATEVVAQWDGGSLNRQEIANLAQRRHFISMFLRNIQMVGAQRIMEEGGQPTQPNVPNFILNENPPPGSVEADVVSRRVFAELASEAGITISDNLVNHYLNEIGLRRVSGDEIVQFLGSGIAGMSAKMAEEQLFSGLQEMLLGEYYLNSYGSAIRNVLPQQRWQDWLQINNRIALEAAILPAKKFLDQTADPSEEELKAFYNANKERIVDSQQIVAGVRLPAPDPGFRQPRRVKLQYLQGNSTVWAEKYLESITDEEIADYYERNKRSLFVKPEDDTATTTDETDEKSVEESTEEEATEEEAPVESEASEEESTDPADTEESANPPAEDESETVEEKTEESAPQEESAEESEASTTEPAEEPATDESSRVQKHSPFRLVSLQEEDEAESEESEPETEAATEENEAAADESSESETEAPANEESDETADEATAADDEEEVEYEPLESVSDQIRRQLATDKAVVELQKVMELALAELQSEYNTYGGERIAAQTQDKELPPVPTILADQSSLAKKYDLVYESTQALSPRELIDTFVGKAVDSQTRSQKIANLAFTNLALHEPILAQDIDGQWFLVLKTEDIESQVPEFESIRDEVADAWKRSKASELAFETAQQLANEAQSAEGTLADFMKDKGYDVVTTDLFSARTFGTTQAEMRGGARLGEAPPLSAVGADFMDEAFKLEPKQVVALQNHNRSDSYVVRLDRREKTEEELRKLFLNEANNWYGIQAMTTARWQRAQQQLQRQLNDRTGFDSEKFSKYLQEIAAR